jgi:hypothetical protein
MPSGRSVADVDPARKPGPPGDNREVHRGLKRLELASNMRRVLIGGRKVAEHGRVAMILV